MTSTTITRQGDTWDILAKRLFGNEHYMEELIAANTDHRKTVVFSYGTRINVPDVDTEATAVSDNLPPWKQP